MTIINRDNEIKNILNTNSKKIKELNNNGEVFSLDLNSISELSDLINIVLDKFNNEKKIFLKNINLLENIKEELIQIDLEEIDIFSKEIKGISKLKELSDKILSKFKKDFSNKDNINENDKNIYQENKQTLGKYLYSNIKDDTRLLEDYLIYDENVDEDFHNDIGIFAINFFDKDKVIYNVKQIHKLDNEYDCEDYEDLINIYEADKIYDNNEKYIIDLPELSVRLSYYTKENKIYSNIIFSKEFALKAINKSEDDYSHNIEKNNTATLHPVFNDFYEEVLKEVLEYLKQNNINYNLFEQDELLWDIYGIEVDTTDKKILEYIIGKTTEKRIKNYGELYYILSTDEEGNYYGILKNIENFNVFFEEKIINPSDNLTNLPKLVANTLNNEQSIMFIDKVISNDILFNELENFVENDLQTIKESIIDKIEEYINRDRIPLDYNLNFTIELADSDEFPTLNFIDGIDLDLKINISIDKNNNYNLDNLNNIESLIYLKLRDIIILKVYQKSLFYSNYIRGVNRDIFDIKNFELENIRNIINYIKLYDRDGYPILILDIVYYFGEK